MARRLGLRAAMRYAEIINAAAARYGVPAELVAGVVAAESAFNPNAYRAEPQLGDASRGLMQLLERTARELGYAGPAAGLYEPAVNVNLGAQLMRANYERARAAAPLVGDYELWTRALSAYNAGFSTVRPGDAKRDAAGRVVNQPYIDRVRRWALRIGGGWGVTLGTLAVLVMLGLALTAGRKVPTSDA